MLDDEKVYKLFCRTYNRDNYNCAHFAAELWKDETGQDILQWLLPLMPRDAAETQLALGRVFKRETAPDTKAGPFLALMRRPKSASHIGVLLRGKLWHLHEKGAEALPAKVAARGFTEVRYYSYKPLEVDGD